MTPLGEGVPEGEPGKGGGRCTHQCADPTGQRRGDLGRDGHHTGWVWGSPRTESGKGEGLADRGPAKGREVEGPGVTSVSREGAQQASCGRTPGATCGCRVPLLRGEPPQKPSKWCTGHKSTQPTEKDDSVLETEQGPRGNGRPGRGGGNLLQAGLRGLLGGAGGGDPAPVSATWGRMWRPWSAFSISFVSF